LGTSLWAWGKGNAPERIGSKGLVMTMGGDARGKEWKGLKVELYTPRKE